MTRLVSHRILLAILASLITQLGGTLGAKAENRIALVIGQSAYRQVTPLSNTANDAKRMTELLTSAGFNVTAAADLSQNDMRQTIADFASKVAASGPETVVAVFYAGHGLQIDGENYLVPVDIDPKRESDIPLEAVRLNDLMNTLGALPTVMRIYMLDACRDNPFPALSGATGRGLAVVDTKAGAQGSFISFSTSPGAEAEDGTGADSPYTTALLSVARKPVPIEEAFKQVRVAVAHDTDGRQIPWESSSLTADFKFFGEDTGGGSAAGQPPTTTPKPPAGPTRSVDDWRKDFKGKDAKVAYDLAIAADSVEAYQAFVEMFDGPPYGLRMKLVFERRKEMLAWSDAVLINTAASFEAFLKAYPTSDLAATARKMLERVRNRSLLANAAIAPNAGGTGGGNRSNGSPTPSTPQPTNASLPPTCTCTPLPIPPVIKKGEDTPKKKKPQRDTSTGHKPPTDEDIAQSGHPAGVRPSGPPPEVIEGIGVGIGLGLGGMGSGGGYHGGGSDGGYRQPPATFHPPPATYHQY